MKSPASFSKRAGWPQRPFKLEACVPGNSTPPASSISRRGLSGLSTRSPTAVTGKLCGVERLGRADVADGLLVSIVDHAPENALRAQLPALRVPRVPALGRFAGESTDIFAARAERDGAWRRCVPAEFPASFAEVPHLGASTLTLGLLFGAQDTEISIRHLVGSLA